MLLHSLRAPHPCSKRSTGATSTGLYPRPLLHRSPLHRLHASRPSIPNWPQRIHSHPSTRLVSCQAKRTSSSKGSGGKKGGSGDGFSLSSLDKLLAERPELQVGGQSNSSGGRGRSYAPTNINAGPFKKPTLLESLDKIEAAAFPTPVATADMLINLGHALNREAKYRQLLSVEQTRVAAAMVKLSDLLEQGRHIEQLDGKKLSLSAWAMGKVGSKGIHVSKRLGDAFAECALACPSMDGPEAKGEGWRRWANLLYGLAEAGMVCGSNNVYAAFDKAVNDRLLVEGQDCNGQDVSNIFYATVTAAYDGNLQPLVSTVARDLRRIMQNAAAQAWSNTIWALAKHEEKKAGRLGQGVSVILYQGISAMEDLVHHGKAGPQNLSNVLWALPKLGWKGDMNGIGVLASALAMRAASATPQELANALGALSKLKWKDDMSVAGELARGLAKKASSANPQNLANTLWALSELGLYDASIYSKLMSALTEKVWDADPQNLSNALLACSEAQHWDRNLEVLAEQMNKQSVQQWAQWDPQDVSNTLYSWAVLTAIGAASTSPGFKDMAQRLFKMAAARRGAHGFIISGLRQLFMAHQVAERVGLAGGGLAASKELLEASSSARASSLEIVRQQAKERATRVENEVAASLGHAGYEVERAVIMGNTLVQLHVQGVVVRVAVADDCFHVPSNLVKGRRAIHDVLASWVCKGSVIIWEAEWANLQGDPQRQQAFVAQRLQQGLSKA